MKTVRVPIPGKNYDVLIGSDILDRALKRLEPGKAFIIADANLPSHTRRLERSLKRLGWKVTTFEEVATEAFKDFRRIYPLYGELLKAGADRSSTIFALGGGVIGDAAGFVAGTFLRGIPWVGIPTTLLSQVDSAIGGKTGVNHELGKNLIGAFHQPALVINEIRFLKTLGERDRISGLGEMLKYGLTYDPAFFSYLAKTWRSVVAHSTKQDAKALERAVARCVQWKAKAVEKDERDVTGVREVLNFGHTLGHVLEGITSYKQFRHGEAIILGMRAAVEISRLRGHLADDTAEKIDSFLKTLPVPAVPAKLSEEKVLSYLRKDKKAKDGKVRFVLLKSIGRSLLDREVPDALALQALSSIRSLRGRK